MLNHHPRVRPAFLAIVLAAAAFRNLSAEAGTTTVWLTSDVQGYLVGCDCPTGVSAGLSALHAFLDGRPDEDFIVDAGGFREPGRSDPLLERYMDLAAARIGYDILLTDASDLRDGVKTVRKRAREIPLTAAAGYRVRGLFLSLPGEKAAFRFGNGERSAAIAVSDPAAGARRYTGSDVDTALKALAESNAAFGILVFRGGLSDLEKGLADAEGTAISAVELVVLTGTGSPGVHAETGAAAGTLAVGARKIPWISPAPRGNGIVRLELGDDSEPEIEAFGLVRGEAPESQDILDLGDAFLNELTARALATAAGTRPAAETASADSIEAVYWYPFGCRDCEDFLWSGVPEIEKATGISIAVEEHDTGNPEEFDSLIAEMERRDAELRSVPVMFVGNVILQGDDEIKSGLEAYATGIPGGAKFKTPAGKGGGGARWEPGAVFLAGLLDGVNPCAFSAMVFLVSALALAGRRKRAMIAIGFSYAAGVFIAYSLIGAGLLGGLRRLAVTPGIRRGLEITLAAILAVLAVLSVVDGVRLSRGRSDLLLKLPGKLSARAHGVIRSSVRSGAAAGGAFLLGTIVALIELGCTGQVYLPTIAWMIARGAGARPWFWLAIYNTAFIIPLITVFVVSYKGVSAIRMANAFKRRGAAIKYATAVLFAALAAVMLAA